MTVNSRYSSIIFLHIFLFEVRFYELGISYQATDFKQILSHIPLFFELLAGITTVFVVNLFMILMIGY